MKTIRIALVSSLAVAALIAGGATSQHTTQGHATVTAAMFKPANELCCEG